MSINHALLLASSNDTTVTPRESAFFRRIGDNETMDQLLPEEEDEFFTKDLLGVV